MRRSIDSFRYADADLSRVYEYLVSLKELGLAGDLVKSIEKVLELASLCVATKNVLERTIERSQEILKELETPIVDPA